MEIRKRAKGSAGVYEKGYSLMVRKVERLLEVIVKVLNCVVLDYSFSYAICQGLKLSLVIFIS